MIYCPKCGISSEQQVGAGNASLSCSSCGVVWSEFLELMANDALWPDIIKRDKHDIICPKCGYERFPSDDATSRTKCPSCRVDYTTVFLGKTHQEKPRIIQEPNIPEEPTRPAVSHYTRAYVSQEKFDAPPERKKVNWRYATIAACLLGGVAFTQVRTMQLAQQNAALQEQQLKLAEQEAERQKQQETQRKREKTDAEIKAGWDAVYSAQDVVYKSRMDQLVSDHKTKMAKLKYGQ